MTTIRLLSVIVKESDLLMMTDHTFTNGKRKRMFGSGLSVSMTGVMLRHAVGLTHTNLAKEHNL